MPYRLNLILNSKQSLAFFRQKQKNEDFFIQLLNAWLHFTNNNLPTPKSIEEILDQPIFLKPHTKLAFCSDNPYFYYIPLRNI